MPNRFSKVNKNIYRGGKPSPFDIQYLYDHGIRKIVSLDEDIAREIYPVCRKFNIEHTIIPLTTGDDPNVEKLPKEVLSWGDHPVYVHCMHGKDRTGMICALYRVLVQGWDLKKALKEAYEFGMGNGLEHGETYYDAVYRLTKDNNNTKDMPAMVRENLTLAPAINNQSIPSFSPSWAPYSDPLTEHLNRPANKVDIFYKLAKIRSKININELKQLPWSELHDYIENSGAQYLGGGSSRDVYVLTSRYVIKIAKNEPGEAQNKAEYELYQDPRFKGIVAETISAHPSYWWIISELVKPLDNYSEFEKATGMKFLDFRRFIFRKDHLSKEEIKEGPEFARKILNLVKSNVLNKEDVAALENLGKTADGKVVILDYGATPKVIDQYYELGENPLDYEDELRKAPKSTDPEFLQELSTHYDIYMRRYVANNPNTPIEALQNLTQDSDEIVRENAKKTLKQKQDINHLNVGDIQNFTGLAPFSFPGVSGPMGGIGGSGFVGSTGNSFALLQAAHIFKLASEYDLYRDKVEELSINNPKPFDDWFDGSDRVYIPFAPYSDMTEEDEEVSDLLNEYGFKITDYRAGYCSKDGRTFKIGKALQQIKRQMLEEVKKKNEQEEIYDIDRELNETANYVDSVINQFSSSPLRTSKHNNFYIVISQDPHDIAKMSTDRSWQSCMTLGDGSQHKNVFCEVENGGLVAYIIQENDENISSPLARIHIRRFDNIFGGSIAIPEESVYGTPVQGFLQTVKGWIDQKQGKIGTGVYELKGGEYSDTFSGGVYVATPKDPETILQWLDSEEIEGARKSTWIVKDLFYEDIEDTYGEIHDDVENYTKEFNTRNEAEEYLNFVNTLESNWTEREVFSEMGAEEWGEFDEETGEFALPRFKIIEDISDHTALMKNEAVKGILKADKNTYEQNIINRIKIHIFDYEKYIAGRENLKKQFIKKYPEYLTEEEIKSLDDNENIEYIKSLPPEEQIPHLREWQATILETLQNPDGSIIDEETKRKREMASDAPGLIPHISQRDSFDVHAVYNMEKMVFSPLDKLFDQLPEPIIRELINFSDNLEEKVGITEDSEYGFSIQRSIIHLFAMKGADTPSVQRYYKSLLPNWGYSQYLLGDRGDINVDTLGWAIAKLGENGRDFLPFLREKLEQAKNDMNDIYKEERAQHAKERMINMMKEEIEKYLYVIDCIENGTGHSTKYRFR